jgi:Flp pilus assembly pilin Flp
MRLDKTTLQAFLAAESGGTGLEFAILTAAVGLALSATLYVVRGVVVDEFEAIDKALRHQNSFSR